MPRKRANCYIIAVPNGAGKTTFATEFLPLYANCRNFINPDLLARAYSPFDPDAGMLRAGRAVLERIAEFTEAKKDFAFETTLSGRSYVPLLRKMKSVQTLPAIARHPALPRQFVRSAAVDFQRRGWSDYNQRYRALRAIAAGVCTMKRPNKSSLTQKAMRALSDAVAKVVEEHRRQARPLAVCRWSVECSPKAMTPKVGPKWASCVRPFLRVNESTCSNISSSPFFFSALSLRWQRRKLLPKSGW
jgi:hypothetical protein